MTTSLESKISHKITKLAEAYRCIVIKMSMGQGWPDKLLILPNGKILWVEVKRSASHQPSPLQRYRADELIKYKQNYLLAWSIEQVENKLKELL